MLSPDTFVSLLPASPAACVQSLFILTVCLLSSITLAPAAERKLLLSYGPRRGDTSATSTSTSTTSGNEGKYEQREGLLRAVRKISSVGQIPHGWFFTYYTLYLACAGFWALQYLFPNLTCLNLFAVQYCFRDGNGNNLLRSLASRQVKADPEAPTMAGGQVVLVWGLMLLQAGRRLYECLAVMKPSRSTMWFVHWVVGLGFYFGVSVAIWVEGSAAVLQNSLRFTSLTADAKAKAAVALPPFLFGWVMQHRCHRHLASLKKYSLPDAGMFRRLVCPHYTCECLIYLSLAVAAAPEGRWCNGTMVSVLVFVVVNLGVTAYGTRSWYVEKFGPERVAGKWIMIPWLY